MKPTSFKKNKVIYAIYNYGIFFLTTGFVVSCSIMLFLKTMTHTMGISLTAENISIAAKLTFANVLLLSLLYTLIDTVRRRFTVSRPVKKITDAAQQIIKGDFSVRIEPDHTLAQEDGFDQIIECFNKMTAELAGIETLRTDFVSNVSHELKTPLSVIQNYATMLGYPGLTEEKRLEYSKAVSDASHRLSNLITNILKLNKLENQQIFPSFETYDLTEQLCECLLGFESAWEKKQLSIETDLDECVLVKSDPEMLSLVWNNLFSNAIKFTEPGGTVSLALKKEGEFVCVQISDTGCGISREVGTHIFDKFYQGDTSHATQGNGLGLALVKRVIDIIGCEISVLSEVGKGSTFTVTLRNTERTV